MDVSPLPVPPGGDVNLYVWIDFVCPYCFLGQTVTKRAIEGLAARIVWMPFELRPHPKPTLRPEDDYLPRTWKRSVYPAAERLGVAIKLPTVSPQPYTRAAFIGMQYAIDQGRGDAYVEAVLGAFFQQDRDVGDPDVLADIASACGLAREDFLAALASKQYARRHDTTLFLARRIGIQAVPTILIGNNLLSGMSEAAAIQDAIREADKNLLN